MGADVVSEAQGWIMIVELAIIILILLISRLR